MSLDFLNVDIEPTNRCNASCYFCPRDQTPHQGLMKPETFEKALERVLELVPYARDVLDMEVAVSLCGLGEPLLNKHTPSFVAMVRQAGLRAAMASNGALLSESVAEALLDAGLQSIQINVGERGDEYEELYKLPWERTLENVTRFGQMAEGRCSTQIVLVNHRGVGDHAEQMKEFWRSHGLNDFVEFGLINRGGALFVDFMQYADYPEQHEARRMIAEVRSEPAVCGAPFGLPFVGFDGQYYLCCSDWRKEAPLGSVFERSFVEITGDKLGHVTSREPVCKSCNHDPLNQLTEELRLRAAGLASDEEVRAALDGIVERDEVVRRMMDKMGVAAPPAPDHAVLVDTPRRRSIPLRVL